MLLLLRKGSHNCLDISTRSHHAGRSVSQQHHIMTDELLTAVEKISNKKEWRT